MTKRLVALLTVSGLVAAMAGIGQAGAAVAGKEPKAGPPVIKVGAASRSVLPTIDGSHDYLEGVNPDAADPFSPGLFVPEWDQGRVAVGNGSASAHWVHDDMRVSAVAFKPQQSGKITVMVASNLYMIFGPDADGIRARVAELVGPGLFGQLEIAISADHNHHGPDTAFDINHEWYELMIEQAAAAIVEAISELRPARLDVAETDHFFGLRDSRDPQVIDPTLGVLRATATNGSTIATMLFWANHPETTLFWEPPNESILADCAQIELTPCTFEDSYFTADFPGWATRIVQDELGGEALFFNGAIGGLITPLGANVWEVDEDSPLGLGLLPPAGAEPPLGAADYRERNFRRAFLLGRELAEAALTALESAAPIASPQVEYDVQTFYTRMSNIGFRLLLVRGDDGLTSLGHTPAMLYNCPAAGPKNDTTCVPDAFATEADPVIEADIRVGDHTRSRVGYLRIGPVGMMWLPAEMLPESTIGLPAGYDKDPGQWHEVDLALHASGPAYVPSGYVKNRMSDEYRWVVGLGNDEMGYAVPLSDYRVLCVAACDLLAANGLLDHPDSFAGATCKLVTEDPTQLAQYGPFAPAVAASCKYGQAFGEAEDHYEETNSVGWDMEADVLAAVAAITGNTDPTRVNPEFPGWWVGHVPAG